MARRFLAPIRHLVGAADPTTPTAAAGDEYLNSSAGVKKYYNGTAWVYSNVFPAIFSVQGTLAVGITGRKQRVYNRSGSPWNLIGMNLYITTGPTGAGATIQVNKNGSSWQTLTVAAGANNANSNPGSSVADADYIDVDFTAVGSTVAGADATLTLNFAS